MVDGMRQLNETGYMHNRVRMVVLEASIQTFID
jgi:deoxyribodipyrimidine photolyase